MEALFFNANNEREVVRAEGFEPPSPDLEAGSLPLAYALTNFKSAVLLS